MQFVLSGGPGAGKTTVLQELERRGYRVAPEVARLIIQQQAQVGGNALPWSDREAFAALMLERSVASYIEHAQIDSIVFTDRGIPDTLGYVRLIGIAEPAGLEKACRQYRYAPQVFVAPPWREIYETDSERKQDFAEAERTFVQVRDAYRDCGYQVIELPKVAVDQRADFILARMTE